MLALASVLKPSAKAGLAHPLSVWMPAIKRLLDQGIQVPENISRAIPGWVFPNGTGSSARHQSRPDVILVRFIPGRQAHLDPSKIPPQDRD
eukprot:163758-Pelagomonas_calceolata.AAC.1